jgi:GcrA cell cycle regulator
MRPIRRSWTEADNEQLKALVASGASAVRAAAKFKRSTASVRTQALKLGMSFVPYRIARKKWGEPLAKNAHDSRS